MRTCTVCCHKLRPQIDDAILQNAPFRALVERFNVSLGAVSRHRAHCLAIALQGHREEMGESVAAGMKRLQKRTERILDVAERDDDRSIVLGAIREGRRNLELIARLTGELDEPTPPAEDRRIEIQIIRVTPEHRLPKPAGQVIEALPAPAEE